MIESVAHRGAPETPDSVPEANQQRPERRSTAGETSHQQVESLRDDRRPQGVQDLHQDQAKCQR